MTNRIKPILAVVLLLLPVLYVGSYLALVTPGVYGPSYQTADGYRAFAPYRCHPRFCPQIFWPLELIDRQLRRGSWDASYGYNLPL
jgi:hypothetical protein